jgi:cation diffusion facilitator family transporter
MSAGERVIRVGLLATVLLMIVKIVAGVAGRSEAVLADGIESACDLVAISTAMIGLRIARKPQDEKHRYGHGRAESLSAIVVSFIIVLTGAGILYQAGTTLSGGDFAKPGGIAVAVAGVTIAVKGWLYRYTQAEAANLRSLSLAALAKDHWKDALTSLATLVGVTGAYFGVGFMDPLAAGITSIFIFHIGFAIFRGAADEIMDGTIPREEVQGIESLAEEVEGVEHVHEIRTRRSGRYIIVDLKLDMDPEMTVKKSHEIATEVKRRIFERFLHVGDVMIHINPHDEEHEDLTRL